MMEEIEKISHGLKSVAVHLEEEAFNASNEYREVFARSVYNRYYYACYLYVRSSFKIMEITDGKDTLRHRNIPKKLVGVIEKLEEEKKKASKYEPGFIDIDLLNQAIEAAYELKNIMVKAMKARENADYGPFNNLQFGNQRSFSIRDVNVAQMSQWFNDVIFFTDIIFEAWIQLDV